MEYNIDLVNDNEDKFEEKADNILELKVYDKSGKDISNEVNVNMFFSQNGLLGMGTELIRLAHKFKEGKHMHLEPLEEDMQVQKMGVFLTPKSSEMTILCAEAKVIDDYFKE
jgi:hypothetical protein